MREDETKKTLHQAESRFTKARGAAVSGQNLGRPDTDPEESQADSEIIPERTEEPEIPEWAVTRRRETEREAFRNTIIKPGQKSRGKFIKHAGYGRDSSKELFNEQLIPDSEEREEAPKSNKDANLTASEARPEQDIVKPDIEDTVYIEEASPEIEAIMLGYSGEESYNINATDDINIADDTSVAGGTNVTSSTNDTDESANNTDSETKSNVETAKLTLPKFKKQNPMGEEASILTRAGQKMQNVLSTHTKHMPARKTDTSANTIEEAISMVSAQKEEPEVKETKAADIIPELVIQRRSEAGRRRAMERAHKIDATGSKWAIDDSRLTEQRKAAPEQEIEAPIQPRWEKATGKYEYDEHTAEPVNPTPVLFMPSNNITDVSPSAEAEDTTQSTDNMPPRSRQADELQENLGKTKRMWQRMEGSYTHVADVEKKRDKSITALRFSMPEAETDASIDMTDKEKGANEIQKMEPPTNVMRNPNHDPIYAKNDISDDEERAYTPKKEEKRTRKANNVSRGGANMPEKSNNGIPSKPQSKLWMLPVALILISVLIYGGYRGYVEYGNYMTYAEQKRQILQMEQAVNIDTFYEGITIDGRSVAGYSYEEVRDAFVNRDQTAIQSFGITLAFGDREFVIDAEIANYYFDTEEIVARAYSMGRSSDLASLASRYNEVMRIAAEGANFTISSYYDISRIQEYINQVANELYIAPTDAQVASFDEKTRTFTFISEKEGMSVDATGIFQEVSAALSGNRLTSRFEIPTTALTPSVKKSTLEANFGRVTSFSTTTTPDSKRNTNIQLSTSAISGTMLAPGEVFSFNKATGERTPEKGYQEAGSIKNGILIKEPGGGVCQVSSTLFVAIAQADLEIVNRANHTWPSSYVNIGFDATVDWTSSTDFTFKNNKSTPIFIYAHFENQTLTVEVYGAKLEPGLVIKLESTEDSTKEPDPPITQVNSSLKPGQTNVLREARLGRTATTYRVYYKNGEKIKSVKLCGSVYPAVQGIIEVGPKS